MTGINHESELSWQAQYLVTLEPRFLGQAQHLVMLHRHALLVAACGYMDSGARNAVLFHAKCVSKARQISSANRRVRDDRFILGSCSDHVWIGPAM